MFKIYLFIYFETYRAGMDRPILLSSALSLVLTNVEINKFELHEDPPPPPPKKKNFKRA